MSKVGCLRKWEVEAARDGRLSNESLERHEHHVARCSDCARERQLFEAMTRELNHLSPPPADELILRRGRHALLERAHTGEIAPESSVFRVRFVIAFAVAASVLVAIFAVAPHLSRGPATRLVAVQHLQVPRQAVVASPIGEVSWSRAVTGGHEHITLHRGTLAISVRHTTPNTALVVQVPDGELEDLGTTFSVRVENDITTSIEVRDGAVVFHRTGEADVRVAAGERWAPRMPGAQAPADPSPKSHPGSGSALQHGEPTRVLVDATERGDAAAALEDAAYLRVVALVREGRNDEARVAAKQYLEQFPNGFRKTEVERIAR